MPNLSMERCRGTRPAVDLRPALDHVLGIKTLWLKSYFLQISEMLKQNEEEDNWKIIGFDYKNMGKNCGNMRVT